MEAPARNKISPVVARASALRREGRLDEAIAGLREALVGSPRSVEIHVLLGAYLADRGDHSEAAELLERARAAVPASMTAPIDAGLAACYDVLGRHDEAMAACRRALAVDPSRVSAALLLGAILADTGHVDEAAAIYGSLIESASDELRAQIRAVLAEWRAPG